MRQADNEIQITPELLAGIFEDGNEIHAGIVNGAPKGAKVIGARFDTSPWPMVILTFDQPVPTTVAWKSLPCANDRRKR